MSGTLLVDHVVAVSFNECTVVCRCLDGVISVGDLVISAGREEYERVGALKIVDLVKYGKHLEFVDPPHAVLVRLTGSDCLNVAAETRLKVMPFSSEENQ